MGKPDYFVQLGSANAILEFVRHADDNLWEQPTEGLLPAQALFSHLPQVLEEEAEHLRDILRLLGRLPEQPNNNPSNNNTTLPHFNLPHKDIILDTVCRRLKHEQLLHPDTRENHFRYICSGRGKTPDTPLTWTGRKNLFRAFIQTWFYAQPDMWSTAIACFQHTSGPFQPHIRNGKPPLDDDQQKLDRALNLRN